MLQRNEEQTEGNAVGAVYLWYPQGTAYMCPLGARTCSLHGTALLGTQKALWVDTENARPTEPVSNRHFDNAITSLWEENLVRISCDVTQELF